MLQCAKEDLRGPDKRKVLQQINNHQKFKNISEKNYSYRWR